MGWSDWFSMDYVYHDERPWGVWLWQEALILIVSIISTFVAFGLFVALPLALLYPLIIMVKPSSLIIIILLPCALLYSLILAATAFKKGKI